MRGASDHLSLGKTMRDYDDTFKEMKKENFNLKLRIFFLEERLGTGKKTSAEELANSNLELKVWKELTCLCTLRLAPDKSRQLIVLSPGAGRDLQTGAGREGDSSC